MTTTSSAEPERERAIEWPMTVRALQVAAALGAVYCVWLLHMGGAGWLSLLVIPFGYYAGMVVWMVTALALIAVGKRLDGYFPTWAAVVVQVVLAAPLFIMLSYIMGGV